MRSPKYRLSFLILILRKFLYSFEGLLAEDMLYLAGILVRDLTRNPDMYKKIRQNSMSFIYFFSSLAATFRKRQKAVLVGNDVSALL